MTSEPICFILFNDMRERFIDTGCTYSEVYEPEHVYRFTGDCIVTKAPYTVTVKGEELFLMRQTGSIMALKSLPAGDREFLISGTSPLGWGKMFGGQEDSLDECECDICA